MRIPLLLLASVAALAQPRLPEAVLTSRIQPEYSPEARAANLEGILTVYLEIDADGKPDNVQVIQGLGLGLDEMAVEAVKRWQFKPAMEGSAAARTAQSAEILFHLGPGGGWRIRHTAYTVVREDKFHSEAVVKPSLASYTRPDPGACGSGNALVTVKARIGKDGVPVNVEIFDVPDPAAGKAVLDAAQAWKFNAATGSGEPRTADATLLLECNTGAPRQGAAPALRVGQGVSVPSLLYKVEPEFSEAARKIKHQGNVVLELEVDPAGIATNLKISRMLGEGLDAKAMEALKAWRFKPGMKDGKPVTVSARIEVSFRLM